MNVHFTQRGWGELLSWTPFHPRTADAGVLLNVYRMIEEARRSPFVGIGKPEPLKGKLAGSWSRRLSQEHRLVYRVRGTADVDQFVEISACRGHY